MQNEDVRYLKVDYFTAFNIVFCLQHTSTSSSLVHIVPVNSCGVATVWSLGLPGTQAPHCIGITRVEQAITGKWS